MTMRSMDKAFDTESDDQNWMKLMDGGWEGLWITGECGNGVAR
jgi:hypothetical protein